MRLLCVSPQHQCEAFFRKVWRGCFRKAGKARTIPVALCRQLGLKFYLKCIGAIFGKRYLGLFGFALISNSDAVFAVETSL